METRKISLQGRISTENCDQKFSANEDVSGYPGLASSSFSWKNKLYWIQGITAEVLNLVRAKQTGN